MICTIICKWLYYRYEIRLYVSTKRYLDILSMRQKKRDWKTANFTNRTAKTILGVNKLSILLSFYS